MRLLSVIFSANPASGGPVEWLRQYRSLFQKQGHVVDVACTDAPGEEWLEGWNPPVNALGPAKTSYRYSDNLLPWLREHAGKYDRVIVHGVWQYHSFAVWQALRGSGTPYHVFTHGMLDPWFKRTYPLKHLKKWLYWPWAEYRVLRDATSVLFTCEEERRLARESFWLYRCREQVINYGTSAPTGDAVLQKEAFLQAFPECAGRRCLIFLGRIHEKKGCDLLLRAFGELALREPDWQLVMAGPCKDEEYLKELKSLEGERVTWAGMLTGDLKWGALHASEAFVLPSHQENFGVAVVEALACGVPVLISDQVNIWREIVGDGAGLVAPDTLEGTRRLLEEWLGMTVDERTQMKVRAVKCFTERFEIGRATESFMKALQEGASRSS
ncbi:glycosyltransferase [Phragmitibacter flavus]|uniref:Glycosyltransferase n=1 Tax=Phragmitibacter flavus TaxID=2576071 RepID=A0A5R8K7V2_9BACT|nr:glycosyltransferase [Phragmitibacter flavus]TLD68413.1 glycosyltransferase [Phragmitibacter flavus]